MALIDCPGCNQKISEKARVCPKCGYVQNQDVSFNSKGYKLCEECGALLAEGLLECPNCGNPIQITNEVELTQKVEVTSIRIPKLKKKTKMLILIGIASILVAILGVIFVTSQIDKKNAETYLENYVRNLNLVTYRMLSGAADAETAGNLTRAVWYNSIYQESDSSTDKYTRNSSGKYYDDFNTALINLFSDSGFTAQIEEIKDNQDVVIDLMKQLGNPPEEYKDAYLVLKDYYDAYYTLTTLAINPTGSLQTYTDNFNEADSDVLKYYNSMELYLD